MQKYDTGQAMKKLLSCLIQDAHSSVPDVILSRMRVVLQKGDLSGLREVIIPDAYEASPYCFKWSAQLRDLLKKFRFSDDMYTRDELEELTIGKFMAVQTANPSTRPDSEIISSVLRKARGICREILGKYDAARHIELCRFGSRAAKGVSLRNAALDKRLGLLTGSVDHIAWFQNHVLPEDNLLRLAIREAREIIRPGLVSVCSSLDLQCVPKSYKSLRTIMPNSGIGNFYTNGLGDLIVERLDEYGLKIGLMQEKHKRYARLASITRRIVTADLSAASDSFTTWLVNSVVPREWFQVLKLGRIPDVTLEDGSTQRLTSFMGMGIGYTFPLQTLIFYSLIKAIGAHLGVAGIYSVYGDDLVYPRKIHRYVKAIFPRLGFNLNGDKTHVTTSFRESCGGDFFDGVDVRPFSPEGEQQQCDGKVYSAFLYKLLNGLRRRWDDCEIATCMHFLMQELAVLTMGRVFQVPPDFPDNSGVQVKKPVVSDLFYPVTFDLRTWSHSFIYLSECADGRVVTCQRGFLWEALRQPFEKEEIKPYTFRSQRLKWVKMQFKHGRPRRQSYVKCGLVWLRRLVAHVSVTRVTHIYCKTGQSSNWS